MIAAAWLLCPQHRGSQSDEATEHLTSTTAATTSAATFSNGDVGLRSLHRRHVRLQCRGRRQRQPTSRPATGNCKGNNKDVQEFSFGYWYNFYNGPKGRFRYGLPVQLHSSAISGPARAAPPTPAATQGHRQHLRDLASVITCRKRGSAIQRRGVEKSAPLLFG